MKSTYSAEYRRLLAMLIEARQRADVTQQDLARQLRRPQSFVSKVERGERRIDVIDFIDICRVIGADPVAIIRRLVRA